MNGALYLLLMSKAELDTSLYIHFRPPLSGIVRASSTSGIVLAPTFTGQVV